ncbi:MAG: hypothetical protein HOI31_01480 [Gammaproteobacteria bacterium]|jgi:hypothetical protein|nr:hypothetical protein [Gammaproteobacteria bacterium]MBT5744944.1 hypothetical protein [Gammaproteobacteria bacterium]MBT7829825.1 hypothetical protein [Candidatus Neomarinimicrobiota bacterium]
MMKWSKIALAVVLPLVMGNSFALSGEELGQIEEFKGELLAIEEYGSLSAKTISLIRENGGAASGEYAVANGFRSYYGNVISIRQNSMRIYYIKRFIQIYSNAVKRSERLMKFFNRISKRVRDRISIAPWYERYLARVAFYRTELVRYRAYLNLPTEVSREVVVTQQEEITEGEPKLTETTTIEEVVEFEGT